MVFIKSDFEGINSMIPLIFLYLLGNQLDGIVIHDEEMLERWNKVYPNGYELVKGLTIHSRLTP